MKKSYIPPKSNLYVLNFEENIATSIGGSDDTGDSVQGLMIILFTSETSPCRKYYTGSQVAINRVDTDGVYDGTFMEYFMDMSAQGAPASCLQPS